MSLKAVRMCVDCDFLGVKLIAGLHLLLDEDSARTATAFMSRSGLLWPQFLVHNLV